MEFGIHAADDLVHVFRIVDIIQGVHIHNEQLAAGVTPDPILILTVEVFQVFDGDARLVVTAPFGDLVREFGYAGA